MKTCNRPNCPEHNPQPMVNFERNCQQKDRFRGECKTCRRAEHRARYVANPGKYKNLVLKRLYNITLSEYEKIEAQQDFCCAICKTHKSQLKRDLCVDHDHKTGVIRGLLCDACNRGIGLLKDKASTLAEAFAYLNKGDANEQL